MDRGRALRDQLAYYRRRLAEGVGGEVAQIYLREIARADEELRRLERDRSNDAGGRLAWHDAFAVGHPTLDAQHRDLIGRINRLCAALDAKADLTPKHPELHALVHAATEHFEHEIAVLKGVLAGEHAAPAKAIGRLAIDEHDTAHHHALDELHAIVRRIEQAFADELPRHADELVRWFITHAVKYDADLKAVFQAV